MCTEGNTPAPNPPPDRHAPGVNGWTLCGEPATGAFIDSRVATCASCVRAHVDVLRLIAEHRADPVALRRAAIVAGHAADILTSEVGQ